MYKHRVALHTLCHWLLQYGHCERALVLHSHSTNGEFVIVLLIAALCKLEGHHKMCET